VTFLWNFSKLSSKVSRYELGEPLERTYEKEIEEALKEK